MKYSVLTSLAVCLTLLLVSAAVRPRATYELLTGNSFKDAEDTFNAQKTRSEVAWADVEAEAENGNPDAMYLVANRLQHSWRTVNGNLVAPDSAGAERTYRASAEMGHVRSMLAVWRIEGMDPLKLIDITTFALESNAEIAALGELSFFLINVGFNNCNSEIIETASKVRNALEGKDREDVYFDLEERMRIELEKRCQISVP